MSRSYNLAEVRVGAGPVVGIVSRQVAGKIAEQRALFGSRYEKESEIRQGWPSALTRELELRRTLAVNPSAVFRNEKDDPSFELNEKNMIKVIENSEIEIGVLYDKHNRLISFTKGSKENVFFNALTSQMEGGHTIHNHPTGGPPSSGDLFAHQYYKCASSKIISKEGVYTIRGDGKGINGLKEELTGVQMQAVSRAYDWAKELLAKGLSETKANSLRAARNPEDVRFEIGDKIANQFDAIINKIVWEETKRVAADWGFKTEFEQAKSFKSTQGFGSYDKIPLPPKDWIPKSNYE